MSNLRFEWPILVPKRPGDKLLELWGRRQTTRAARSGGRKGVGISALFGCAKLV